MNKQHFKIGFSPCPNDTFIFDAMLHNKIDTGNLAFEAVMHDVQMLNQMALAQELPISKISFGVWPLVKEHYDLLDSGAALGVGVGPLLITGTNDSTDIRPTDVVAIPGENTTAHFLFRNAYPGHQQRVFLRYDEIENYVASDKGPGVIIHENRFTYADKGLHKIADLGDFWERKTGLPIPLGGIVIKKSIPKEIQAAVNDCIRRSVEYSFSKYPELSDFIRCNAQEMSEDVMRKHIQLYVNEFTKSLGEKGRKAIERIEKQKQ